MGVGVDVSVGKQSFVLQSDSNGGLVPKKVVDLNLAENVPNRRCYLERRMYSMRSLEFCNIWEAHSNEIPMLGRTLETEYDSPKSKRIGMCLLQ